MQAIAPTATSGRLRLGASANDDLLGAAEIPNARSSAKRSRTSDDAG
jgi:hypothetical protein